MTDQSSRETGLTFMPKYDSNGLVAAVAQDHQTGAILMLAYMNADAFKATVRTGEAHYWSRSRQALWHKGATSGDRQKVVEMLIDCDQDAVIVKVEQLGTGGACHTGAANCFYRKVDLDAARGAGDVTALLPA